MNAIRPYQIKAVRVTLPNGTQRVVKQRVPVSLPPEPKICLGCGAKQQPDGSLPCGH